MSDLRWLHTVGVWTNLFVAFVFFVVGSLQRDTGWLAWSIFFAIWSIIAWVYQQSTEAERRE